MNVSIIKSRDSRGSLDAMVDALGRTFGGKLDDRYIVLVKDNFSLTVERDILSRLKMQGTFNIDVLSFSRLINKLLGGSADREYLSKYGGVMVVSRIIYDLRNKFQCYKSNVGVLGFAEKVYELLLEFENAGISPEMIENASKKVPMHLKNKLADIHAIYSQYEKIVKFRYYDMSTKYDMLCELIDKSLDIGSYHIYTLNFDSYTKKDYKVISRLISRCKSVTLSVVESPDYIYACGAEVRILDICQSLDANVLQVSSEARYSRETQLIHEYMFSYRRCEPIHSSAVSLYEGNDINDEIEFIASDILLKVRKGERFYDFGVVCQDFEAYRLAMERAMTLRGIKYYMSDNAELFNHPTVKFLLGILELGLENTRQSALKCLAIMKNPLFFGNYEDICLFENYVIKFGLKLKDMFAGFRFEDKNLERFDKLRLDINNIMAIAKIDDVMSGGAYSKNVREILETLDIERRTALYAERMKDNSKYASEFSEQVIDKTLSVLAEIEKVYSDYVMPFDEFLYLLKNGLQSVSVSLIPIGFDSVFVGSLNDMKYQKKKHLYIIGACQGAIPGAAVNYGLLSIKDTETLAQLGIEGVSYEYISQMSMFDCYSALHNFTHTLTVSYPRFYNGSVAIASKVIDFLQGMFDIGVQSRMSVSDIKLHEFKSENFESVAGYTFSSLKQAKQKFISAARAMSDGYATGANYYYNLAQYMKRHGDNEWVKGVAEIIRCGNIVTKLSDAEILFFSNKSVSATAIERYYSCPYKFFIERGLGAKRREEFELSSLDIGEFMHAVCELYSRGAVSIKLIREQSDALVELCIAEVMKKYAAKSESAAQNVMFSRLRQEAQNVCFHILKQLKCGKFTLQNAEYTFDRGEGIRIYKDIALTGKIDRIDTFNDYARIIDYKTGKAAFRLEDLFMGKSLQLPLYMAQVESGGKKSGGMFYFPVHYDYTSGEEKDYRLVGNMLSDEHIVEAMDVGINEKSDIINVYRTAQGYSSKADNYLVSRDNLSVIMDYAKIVGGIATGNISSGNIGASPCAGACEYCEFKTICGYDFSSRTERIGKGKCDMQTLQEAVEIWNGLKNKDVQ